MLMPLESFQELPHHFLPILGCPNTDIDSKSSIDTLRSLGRRSPWFAKNGNSFTIFPYKFVNSWRRFTVIKQKSHVILTKTYLDIN